MAEDKSAKHYSDVANAEREVLKQKQQLNRYQAIPKSSTGETHNLGNAPTPDPLEPTVNEPGFVMFQTPPPPESQQAAPPPKPAAPKP
jgi:hypothetical protein